MKRILILTVCFLLIAGVYAQKGGKYQLKSPDGTIVLSIQTGDKLQWSVTDKGKSIITPSPISITLGTGEVLGERSKVVSATNEEINFTFNPVHYRKAQVTDHCNQLILKCRGNYGLIFRVYNDAVAYKFFTTIPGDVTIKNEEVNFNFAGDYKIFVPFQRDCRDGKNFNSSFENQYSEITFSRFPKDTLAFLPVLVDLGSNQKAEIFEVDLEDYPGMYVRTNPTNQGFEGVFAPYPLETYVKGLNIIPSKSADYIAKRPGMLNLPWRAVFISEQDKDLLDIDIVQKLASESRLNDISWVKVGQVAWDWWNDLNISHVDFRAGMNTETYKYFIDFAAQYGISYILFDAGWNVPGDLTKPIPEIDIQQVIDYGKQKGVGLIVWCSWQDVMAQKDKAFPFFAGIGVKGMKIDFFDRDDQLAVASTYEIAKQAAQNKLMVDYHGIYKPTGLQKTYPNVVGIEGVYGLENYKWANPNGPRYAVTLPFIRNQAGPMDYTPGAMRNASRENFRPVNSNPMAQGTRVQQMAMYIVFEVPLQMLSDNPTIYMREKECTEFITRIPTTFDQSVPLESKVAEYVAVARKKGNVWYAGAMTDWTPRELTIDCSFLGSGSYTAEIFSDGVNADRDATDYKKSVITVTSTDKLNVKLMNGGGWVARFEPVKQ
ncbi:MAG TPA: glycoside hydrolase family 97 protein [Bacteroidales bacterium]|nr:glycoside hydrolase family 97 protein [Bacteroidales bacterium]